jgi:hypothetical protein
MKRRNFIKNSFVLGGFSTIVTPIAGVAEYD